jgi:N-acyl homoserine lactone hydrolase
MKRIALTLLLLLLAALLALGLTLLPQKLPVGEDYVFVMPEPRPPPQMRLAALPAGEMDALAVLAYRGGSAFERRRFSIGGILVEHPGGNLLFDTGFGSAVDRHFQTTPKLLQATSRYRKDGTVADQLRAASLRADGVILTHAHWDHVSGLPDLPAVPIWVNAAERQFIDQGGAPTALIRSFEMLNFRNYEFNGGPYLGFERSLDVHGDGSVVLVPAPGHTPGSIIAFIHTPDGRHYALVGDLVWQKEGIDLPAERPWLPRRLVDWDADQVRKLIVHMHQLQKALPELTVVPAHDARVWARLPKLGDG